MLFLSNFMRGSISRFSYNQHLNKSLLVILKVNTLSLEEKDQSEVFYIIIIYRPKMMEVMRQNS
jgi:hypothetical protein